MLTLINMDIAVMILDFMHVFFFFLLQRGNGFSKNFHIFGFSLSSVHCDNVWQID